MDFIDMSRNGVYGDWSRRGIPIGFIPSWPCFPESRTGLLFLSFNTDTGGNYYRGSARRVYEPLFSGKKSTGQRYLPRMPSFLNRFAGSYRVKPLRLPTTSLPWVHSLETRRLTL